MNFIIITNPFYFEESVLYEDNRRSALFSIDGRHCNNLRCMRTFWRSNKKKTELGNKGVGRKISGGWASGKKTEK